MKNLLLVPLFFASALLSAQTTVSVSVSNNKLLIINTSNGDTIIAPNVVQLWDTFSVAEHPKPETVPSVAWQAVSNGCNITYAYNNSSGITRSLGKLVIDGVLKGDSIYARAFEDEGAEIKYNNKSFAYSRLYPKNLFSPVMVLNSGKYTVCFSLLYPVLDYKHHIDISLTSTKTGGKRWWRSSFILNEYTTDSTLYSYQGDIKAGQQRSYTLCIRVITNTFACESWLGGLQPYKDHFRKLYGGLHYQSDGRPLKQFASSSASFCSASNPYCFTNYLGNNNMRPDLKGFGPISRDLIKQYNQQNYERLMLFKPTGIFWKTVSLNFPFKFTSHWLEGDTTVFPHSYGHIMQDATDSLKNIPAPNRELGLWWGNAGEVMFAWDTNYSRTLDPYDTVLVKLANKELDLAVQAGATLIGLDAFRVKMPAWNGYQWILKMKQRAPNVKFLTERWGCDLFQTQAGMIAIDQQNNIISGPHYLSDFLLPGTEKIGILDGSQHDTTRAMRLAKMLLLSSWGYGVCNSNPDTMIGAYTPAKIYYQNNPSPDLGADTTICSGDSIILTALCKNSLSYLWSTGATTASITAKTPGIYWVRTTTSTSCIVRDTVVLTPCLTNVKEIAKAANLRIYPNPTSSKLYLELPGKKIDAVLVFDLFGRAVAFNRGSTIDVSALVSGMYIVQVRSPEGFWQSRFIKE